MVEVGGVDELAARPCRGWVTARPGRADAGSSLVEMVVGVFVLAVGVMAMVGVAVKAFESLGESRQRQLATAEATRSLESARALPFPKLAQRAGATTPATWDPDGDGPLAAETVHATADGALDGPPYRADSNGRVLTTYVTVPSLGVPGTSVRRVTAVISWDRAGTVGQVRSSTLVSDVARGPTP